MDYYHTSCMFMTRIVSLDQLQLTRRGNPERDIYINNICMAQLKHMRFSNNIACATSKGSDQPWHTRRLIRAFVSRLNNL